MKANDSNIPMFFNVLAILSLVAAAFAFLIGFVNSNPRDGLFIAAGLIGSALLLGAGGLALALLQDIRNALVVKAPPEAQEADKAA